FRTWAPRARAAYLIEQRQLRAISEAGWRPSEDNRLEALGDETWGGFLADAEDGYRYMFWVDGAGEDGRHDNDGERGGCGSRVLRAGQGFGYRVSGYPYSWAVQRPQC